MSATHSLAATAEMAVPFVRLDKDDPELLEELLAEVRAVAEESAFTLGDRVEAFEADFAAYCEADEAIGVGSGTDALALSLRALGIGPGHEVIVPANTFIATAESVSVAGAIPRFVDVDPESGLITAEIVERALNPRVRAVIPVHLYGATVDMDPLLEVAREAKLAVVEDACQAHGARYRGRRVGALGDIGCFSFYPAKNLGAWGDGGAAVTNRPELAERVRLLRSHGERPRYRHRVIGTTARLDGLQAAVLRVKLGRLDGWNAQRRRAAAELRRALHAAGVLAPPSPVDGGDHVYHLFVVRCADRDLVRAHLTARGIASAVHYPVPVHRTEAYAHLGYKQGSLPVAEEMAEQVCSLPIFPGLDDEQINAIAAAVADLNNRMSVDVSDARRQEESFVAMRSDIVDFASLAQGPQIIGKRRHEAEPLGVAVVGYGYWGPNLVRNVIDGPEFELRTLCEMSSARASAFAQKHPGVPVQSSLDAVLRDQSVDAVIVATPPRTHHAIVKAAIEAGKHVLVEKPLATTSADALDLVERAEDRGRVLMPGHTFCYSPSVNKVRDLIREDLLGEVYFVTSSRMNLGKYQPDGVIMDLAPHDLSILLYWLEQPIVEVAATARSIFQAEIPETAFITLTFEGGAQANIQISWLAPRKVREMTIVGSRRMVQYDDTATDEPVRVYDRGMEFSTPASFGEYKLTYRTGDMVVPRVDAAEPLSLELQDFASAIVTGSQPRSNSQLGLQIVAAMEAAEISLRRRGEPIEIGERARAAA